MQLTRAADYAVRMMIHLATLPPGSRTNRAALAAASSVPEPFVGKILQTLTKSGLIDSQRGMNGGFALSASPEAGFDSRYRRSPRRAHHTQHLRQTRRDLRP